MAQVINSENTHSVHIGEATMGYNQLNVSKYVIASMIGCWQWESGVNSGIWESLIEKDWDYVYDQAHPNQGGYGLGQWTNTSANGRLYQLHEFVTNQGYGDGSGVGQLEFLLYENYWTPKQESIYGYSTLTQFLQSSSTNIDALVWDFLACWEGVVGNHYEDRKRYAHNALDYIEAHIEDGDIYSWTSRNNYLSESQRNANIMCIYWYIRTGASGSNIYVSSTGNGTAYAVPNAVEVGEDFTIYAIPNPPDEIVLITGWTADGYSIAMGQGEEETYTYQQAYGDHITVEVQFTGDTPVPPTPPERKKMPLWMYTKRRRYI